MSRQRHLCVGRTFGAMDSSVEESCLAAVVSAAYAGTRSLAEGRKLAAVVLSGSASASRRDGCGGNGALHLLREKEALMKAAADVLGRPVGVGALKAILSSIGRRDLSNKVGRLNEMRKTTAHPGTIVDEVTEALRNSSAVPGLGNRGCKVFAIRDDDVFTEAAASTCDDLVGDAAIDSLSHERGFTCG